MSWPFIFAATNGWALIGWLMLAFLPRRPLVLSAITYLIVLALCAAYALLLLGLVSGWIDGRQVTGGGSAGFTTIEGVRAIFGSDGGVVVGWTHYLAFDLFVGLWIARDADSKGFNRLVQLPILLLTFVAGPVGLLLWLLVREARARALTRAPRP